MAYTHKIQFSTRTINSDGDTIRMDITFNNVGTGSNSTTDAIDDGMLVMKYGKLSLKFDFDNPLILPGQQTFKISDIDLFLQDYFFADDDWEKDALVEVYLNSNLEFSGVITEDSIEYNHDNRIASFTAIPETDKINEAVIYNRDEDPAVFLDPLGYDAAGVGSDRVQFRRILLDTFKLVNSSLVDSDLILKSDWYYDNRDPASTTYPLKDGNSHELFDLFVTALHFRDTAQPYDNMGGYLKMNAFSHFAMIGFLNRSKPFFIELAIYDSSNTQTLGKVLSFQESYNFGLITYYQVTNAYDIYRILYGDLNFDPSRSKREKVTAYHYRDTNGTPAQNLAACQAADSAGGFTAQAQAWIGSGSPTVWHQPITLDSDWQPVYWSYHPVFGTTPSDAFTCEHELTMRLNHYYRSARSKMKVASILVDGVNYDFFKNFTYDSIKYQIIGMEKDYHQNRTKLDCLNLGAVT